MRDTVFFAFGQFGEAANDSLISLLESSDETVRQMSFNDLATINLTEVKKNEDLRMYDPSAPDEVRSRAVERWRQWWTKLKQAKGRQP